MIHVAVGIVIDSQQRVLIAKRPLEKHQGGLWEFPGGKIEKDETSTQALCRELFEELGIQVLNVKPLVKVPFEYSDKSVLLDVFLIDKFDGCVVGQEGQLVRWVHFSGLSQYQFPKANKLILDSISALNNDLNN